MIRIAMALLLFVSTAANAEIYRCAVGGKMLFQDKPCAGASRDDNQVEVKATPAVVAAPAAVDPEVESAPKSAPAATSTQDWIKQRDLENRRNKLKSTISKLEQKGRKIRSEHNRDMALLDAEGSTANNNLAGATYLQSIAAKKQALATTYEADIAANQSAIDRAAQDLRELE